jgi:hypothetical protein
MIDLPSAVVAGRYPAAPEGYKTPRIFPKQMRVQVSPGPDFVTIRVDDDEHLDMWLEIQIDREEFVNVVQTADTMAEEEFLKGMGVLDEQGRSKEDSDLREV